MLIMKEQNDILRLVQDRDDKVTYVKSRLRSILVG